MARIDKRISVVIPCYNEEVNIRELYGRLKDTLTKLTSNYEIIFVDNKSIDNSEKIFRGIANKDKNVSIILFSRNFGNSQYGYSAGTEYASGDCVVWMEGDLQDSPEMIEKLVRKWQEGFEVVYGVRPKAVGSFFSKKGRQLFYKVFQKLSYLDIPVDAGDFSLLDRKVVDVINSMPERSRFVRGLRAWAGFKHAGVEYERNERAGGVSSNNMSKNIWWAKKFIFSFSTAPLEFISFAALFLFVLAFTMTAVIPFLIFAGYLPLITGFVVITGLWAIVIVMISLSIIAETLTIIFEEVKGRPKYIISEIINDHRL